MFFSRSSGSRSSSKLASLFLLSGLLSTAISPSFAADPPAPSAIQQTQLLAERYGLTATTESDSIDEVDASDPLTQSDFLSSAQPFFDRANLVFTRDLSTFELLERLHFMAVRYLADQYTDLQAEADSLIAQVPQVQHTSQVSQSTHHRPSRPLLRSQQKSIVNQLAYSALKEEDTQNPAELPEAANEQAVQIALERLQEIGIDFSLADSTFQPDQLLTRGEYLQALRQVDQFLIEIQYSDSTGIETILDVDSVRIVAEFENVNETMNQISAGIAEVRSLTHRLQAEIARQSTQSSRVKSALGNQGSKPNNKDGSTVENTPAPPNLIESTDEALVTQGDFALYITSQITQVLNSRVSFANREDLHYLAVVYAELSAEVAEMTAELESAIAQLD